MTDRCIIFNMNTSWGWLDCYCYNSKISFGGIKNVTSTGIIECIWGECMYILYNIEMIMLTTWMMWVLLTHEVENTSGTIRYYNKKVVC